MCVQDHMRMAVSHDIDTSMLDTVEFFFTYGCRGSQRVIWPRHESVLLQYSANGGISWHLIKEIHYNVHQEAR